MRTVGSRKEREITFHASSENLERGVRFNDEMHRVFSTGSPGVKKGVYRFASHGAANEHSDQCIAEAMARQAARVANGR